MKKRPVTPSRSSKREHGGSRRRGHRSPEPGEPSEGADPDVPRRVLRDAADVRVRQPVGLAVGREPPTVGVEAGEPALRAHPEVAAGVDVQRVHERAQRRRRRPGRRPRSCRTRPLRRSTSSTPAGCASQRPPFVPSAASQDRAHPGSRVAVAQRHERSRGARRRGTRRRSSRRAARPRPRRGRARRCRSWPSARRPAGGRSARVRCGCRCGRDRRSRGRPRSRRRDRPGRSGRRSGPSPFSPGGSGWRLTCPVRGSTTCSPPPSVPTQMRPSSPSAIDVTRGSPSPSRPARIASNRCASGESQLTPKPLAPAQTRPWSSR